MEEAERIAKSEHCSNKLAVISGVGTRNYYRLVLLKKVTAKNINDNLY